MGKNGHTKPISLEPVREESFWMIAKNRFHRFVSFFTKPGFAFRLTRHTLRPFVKTFLIRSIEGLENIPKDTPVIVAFNHQSYFDFICFIAIAPDNIHYLAAEKFFTHPFWKVAMKLTGQIKVERTSKEKDAVHATVYSHLEQKRMIGIFPEGTRSLSPTHMLEAFTGVAKYALGAKVPVVPVGIRGTYDVLPKGGKFPAIKKIVSFHVGKPMHFHDFYKEEITLDDYEQVTELIMQEISRLSGKVHVGVKKHAEK